MKEFQGAQQKLEQSFQKSEQSENPCTNCGIKEKLEEMNAKLAQARSNESVLQKQLDSIASTMKEMKELETICEKTTESLKRQYPETQKKPGKTRGAPPKKRIRK